MILSEEPRFVDEHDVHLSKRAIQGAVVAVDDVVGHEAALLHEQNDIVELRSFLLESEERHLEDYDLCCGERLLSASQNIEFGTLHVDFDEKRPAQSLFLENVVDRDLRNCGLESICFRSHGLLVQ